jgi:wyosine [tRNA(Phe)-imidazoG37] synthetase (radical SAM superfamily)
MTAKPTRSQCVYGPVPSRRLGRSLGVDLVPFKTCTYDCVYCQLGRTTDRTIRRRRWADPDDVVTQVRARLSAEPEIITIAGSGEPTLHSGIGEVIAGIKESTDVPVAVLTNGSLLGLPEVQRELALADIVIPSLDAPDEGLFRLVNRPHRALRFSEVVEGMAAFRDGFRGQFWLEVLLLAGVTGMPEEVERLATIAGRLAPERIQLNTVARPPAESFAEAVLPERLMEFSGMFTPRAEVVAPVALTVPGLAASRADVLALVARRPCTLADIAAGLGIHRNEAVKVVTTLIGDGLVESAMHSGMLFYMAAEAAVHDSIKERA